MTLTRPHRRLPLIPLRSYRRRGTARNKVVIALGIVAVVLSAVAAWFYFQPNGGPKPNDGDQTNASQPKIDAESAAELIRKARAANGYLEDEFEDVGVDAQGRKLIGYVEAEKRYLELRSELPNELLPIRNLTICRLLYLLYVQKKTELMSDEERASLVEKIRQNLDDLKKQEPLSAIPCLLAANFLETTSEGSADQSVLRELKNARKLEPDLSSAHWLFYEKAKFAQPQEAFEEELESAISEMYRIDPDNIHFLNDYYLFLAQRKDNKLVKVLEDSQELMVAAGVMWAAEHPQRNSSGKNDLEQMWDDALVAAKAGDWPKVVQSVRLLGNLVRGMNIQRVDYSRLDVNLLDFMLHDFSDDFYAQVEKNPDEIASTAQPIAELFRESGNRISQLALNDFQPVDFNKDVQVDIVGIAGGKLVVLSPDKEGTDWTTQLEQDLMGDYDGLLCADLDRDAKAMDDETWKTNIEKLVGNAKRLNYLKENPADPDLIVFGPAGLKVFLNDNGLTEVEQSSEIASLKKITAAVLIDIEGDADLDLIVAAEQGIRILLNPGNLRFVDFSAHSLPPADSVEVASLAIADWDRDLDVDVIVGDSAGHSIGVLENMLHGSFRWQPFGPGYKEFTSGRSLNVVEFDGNVSWDLIGASGQGFQLCLTDTSGSQVTPKRTQSFGDQEYMGLTCADLDNDSYLDVIAWSDRQVHFYQGNAEGAFELSDFKVADLEGVQKCVADDMDYDGDLDLIVVSSAGTQIFRNGSQKNGWLTLLPIGIIDNRTRANHNGIGSLVELMADGRYQAQTIAKERIHFGMNGAKNADILRIVWTNGMPQNVIEPSANLIIREVMFEKGSCPFIYVWNGSEFKFFSDCLWAAPIGLRGADGNVVPTREWEYLKIPGDKLKPQNGVYRIQLTEELWETTYFDFVELIAVDHPEEIDIFTNEKVGPPSIAEHKIHTVANKRPPVSARDKSGRDVLPEIAAEDGKYMQGFEKRLYKGLTPLHYLELDLGALQDPRQLTLFLTGWIRPSDSSLNVGFSQNPEVDGPVTPQVWVPDAQGQWQLRIAPMGFPGGKTKTIAVDLSNAFLTDDYRVRIQTSAEIYWDHVFFSVDEASYPLQTHDLPVAAADLHFRGFSHRYYADEKSPEWYDYKSLSTAPRWPPMRGMFTRLGDVKELLTSADDRLAVLGAGDEMTVEFREPEAVLPEGWRRDFILHCVGYDKDADLNTFEGQSSEPLPFRAMSSYPSRLGESFAETPEHQDYLRKYQTRRQSWSRFWKLLQSDSVKDLKTD